MGWPDSPEERGSIMHNDTSDNDSNPLYRPTIPSLGAYHMRYSTTPESFLAARIRRIKQLRKRLRQVKEDVENRQEENMHE